MSKYRTCSVCGCTYTIDEAESDFFHRMNGDIAYDKSCGMCGNCAADKWDEEAEEGVTYEDIYGSDDDIEPGEYLSVDEAADIWASSGEDEDYTFGYSEDELREALNS